MKKNVRKICIPSSIKMFLTFLFINSHHLSLEKSSGKNHDGGTMFKPKMISDESYLLYCSKGNI